MACSVPSRVGFLLLLLTWCAAGSRDGLDEGENAGQTGHRTQSIDARGRQIRQRTTGASRTLASEEHKVSGEGLQQHLELLTKRKHELEQQLAVDHVELKRLDKNIDENTKKESAMAMQISQLTDGRKEAMDEMEQTLQKGTSSMHPSLLEEEPTPDSPATALTAATEEMASHGRDLKSEDTQLQEALVAAKADRDRHVQDQARLAEVRKYAEQRASVLTAGDRELAAQLGHRRQQAQATESTEETGEVDPAFGNDSTALLEAKLDRDSVPTLPGTEKIFESTKEYSEELHGQLHVSQKQLTMVNNELAANAAELKSLEEDIADDELELKKLDAEYGTLRTGQREANSHMRFVMAKAADLGVRRDILTNALLERNGISDPDPLTLKVARYENQVEQARDQQNKVRLQLAEASLRIKQDDEKIQKLEKERNDVASQLEADDVSEEHVNQEMARIEVNAVDDAERAVHSTQGASNLDDGDPMPAPPPQATSNQQVQKPDNDPDADSVAVGDEQVKCRVETRDCNSECAATVNGYTKDKNWCYTTADRSIRTQAWCWCAQATTDQTDSGTIM